VLRRVDEGRALLELRRPPRVRAVAQQQIHDAVGAADAGPGQRRVAPQVLVVRLRACAETKSSTRLQCERIRMF
jgi:hypothetical protein